MSPKMTKPETEKLPERLAAMADALRKQAPVQRSEFRPSYVGTVSTDFNAIASLLDDALAAIRTKGGVELPPEDHREAASIDAVVYGAGYLIDGKHIAPCRVEIIQGRTTPAPAPDAVENRVPRQFGGKTKRLALCPASCGCLWVNHGDGNMSLFGENSKSCDECENLPWALLLPIWLGFNLEQFRRPVELYRAMMECGEMAVGMPIKFRATPDEYRARVIHADMLLSKINEQPNRITARNAVELLELAMPRLRHSEDCDRIASGTGGDCQCGLHQLLELIAHARSAGGEG